MSNNCFFKNQLFLLLLTRYTALPETDGLHWETPSSRYCFTHCLRQILTVHISHELEIPRLLTVYYYKQPFILPPSLNV